MQRLRNCRTVCCLFCPPCPSKIVSKLAFMPPSPSYILIPDESGTKCTLQLNERADWQHSQNELDQIEVYTTTSSRGKRIACTYIKCCQSPKFTILFSHGNGVDFGQMLSFYFLLGTRIHCNIVSYDYSGYGASSGKPSEKNLYADAEAAFTSLSERLNIAPEKVILYGQSIGTVATVDLASRHQVAGVVLHSPLTSGMRVAFPDTSRTWFFDAFPNIEKVPKIKSPVLVIHGTEDEVIDISHGLEIHGRCQTAVEPLWVEGAGHNDVELYAQYLDRLKHLIDIELTS